MTIKIETSKLNLAFLIIAFLINIPFTVLAGMWLWSETSNGMAVVGPIGAWVTLFVGMLWGCRSQIVNLLATIRNQSTLIQDYEKELQKYEKDKK